MQICRRVAVACGEGILMKLFQHFLPAAGAIFRIAVVTFVAFSCPADGYHLHNDINKVRWTLLTTTTPANCKWMMNTWISTSCPSGRCSAAFLFQVASCCRNRSAAGHSWKHRENIVQWVAASDNGALFHLPATAAVELWVAVAAIEFTWHRLESRNIFAADDADDATSSIPSTLPSTLLCRSLLSA